MRLKQKMPVTRFLVCLSIFVLFFIFANLLLSFYFYKKETNKLKEKYTNNLLHNKISTIDHTIYSADRIFNNLYKDFINNNLDINKIDLDAFNLLDIYVYDESSINSNSQTYIDIKNIGLNINDSKDESIFFYKNDVNDFPVIIVTKSIEKTNKILVAIFHMSYTTKFFSRLNDLEKDENVNTFIVYENNDILAFHKSLDDFSIITNTYIQKNNGTNCKFYSIDSSAYKYKYVYYINVANSESDTSFFMIIIAFAILNIIFFIVFIGFYIHYKASKIESTTDALTNIYNRRHLLSMINTYSKKKYYPLAFIVLDIDYLKFINDTFGHVKGDEELKKVADILKSVFRESDIVARIGGDEFAILLPKTPSNVVSHLVERIKECVDSINKRNTDDVPISLTQGFYVAEHELENTEKLFLEADEDMYKNKNQSHKEYLEYLTKWCEEHHVKPPKYNK